MKNWGGQFTPKLGGHFELESGAHFKLELGGQYHWNLHSGYWNRIKIFKGNSVWSFYCFYFILRKRSKA